MPFSSGLGIVLSLVFGFLLLALIAELYYLLWWKKLIIRPNHQHQATTAQDAKEVSSLSYYFLFCFQHRRRSRQQSTHTHTSTTNHQRTTPQDATVVTAEDPSPDIEIGASKEYLLRAFEGGDSRETPELSGGIESELMRLHNLHGPPRFLFTIKEETKEDLESDDGGGRSHKSSNGKKGSRTTTKSNLGDLILSVDDDSNNSHYNPFAPSPVASPPPKVVTKMSDDSVEWCYSRHGINPLFESVWVDAELDRLRSSPPPKFKFLREAEEKLYKRLLEEAEKINCKPGSGGDLVSELDEKDGGGGESRLVKIVVGKNNHHHNHHSSCNQVLPLSSSPSSKLTTGAGVKCKPGSD